MDCLRHYRHIGMIHVGNNSDLGECSLDFNIKFKKHESQLRK